MSFTAELKEEILEKENSKKCCDIAELAGIIAFASTIKNGYIQITLENRIVARRIVKQLEKVAGIRAGIEVKPGGGVRKNDTFIISVTDYKKMLEFLGLGTSLECFPKSIQKSECCQKAFVRGAFLGGGTVSDPQKRYHLEFVTSNAEISEGFAGIFSSLDIKCGRVERRGKYVVYFKDCDTICDVLAMAGVMNGVVEIYEVKVIKDKKNEINRLINSEVANLSKVVDAAISQKAAIEKIRDTVGLDTLPETLKKLAEARLEYPEEGLAQLGARMKPPIGKSGVNHRMRKIIEISKRY